MALALMILAAWLTIPLALFPQAGAEVAVSDVPCGGCSVTARRVLTIGGPSSPLIARPSSVVRLTSGDYLVFSWGPQQSDSLIPVFKPDGTFRRFLAGRGAGPGELTAPVSVSQRFDDTVIVHETAQAHVFTRDLRFVRKERLGSVLPASTPMALLGADGLYAYLRLDIRDSAYFHRVGRTAPRPISAVPADVGSGTAVVARKAAPMGQSFWLLHTFRADGYGITTYDTAGNKGLFLRRRPAWWFPRPQGMPPQVQRAGVSANPADTVVRFGSALLDALEASNGLLYILNRHSSTAWRGVQRGNQYVGDYHRSVIEALDPRFRQLVGRVEIPGFALSLLSGEQVVTYREDSDGFPLLDVWQLAVRARDENRPRPAADRPFVGAGVVSRDPDGPSEASDGRSGPSDLRSRASDRPSERSAALSRRPAKLSGASDFVSEDADQSIGPSANATLPSDQPYEEADQPLVEADRATFQSDRLDGASGEHIFQSDQPIGVTACLSRPSDQPNVEADQVIGEADGETRDPDQSVFQSDRSSGNADQLTRASDQSYGPSDQQSEESAKPYGPSGEESGQSDELYGPSNHPYGEADRSSRDPDQSNGAAALVDAASDRLLLPSASFGARSVRSIPPPPSYYV